MSHRYVDTFIYLLVLKFSCLYGGREWLAPTLELLIRIKSDILTWKALNNNLENGDDDDTHYQQFSTGVFQEF